jgi:hypothetical protein
MFGPRARHLVALSCDSRSAGNPPPPEGIEVTSMPIDVQTLDADRSPKSAHRNFLTEPARRAYGAGFRAIGIGAVAAAATLVARRNEAPMQHPLPALLSKANMLGA